VELNSDEFDKELDALKVQIDRAEELQKSLHGLSNRSSSASNITVNAGGIGVWICCTFCALCLMASLFTLLIVSDYGRKIDRAEEYAQAAYGIATGKQPEKTK
jgi:hypothetical protein